ncbi:MAG: hypothetical protein ACOX5J_04640 [Candidatus Hydrogenedentales bacterium]|jgi:hypothetical protein
MMVNWIVAAALAMAAASSGDATTAETVHWTELQTGALTAVIGDNEPMGEHHRRRYNGVFALATPERAESPFVPMFSGLNLEHYFDAQARTDNDAVFFEPRHVPMELRRIDDNAVELYQATTPFYGVESWTRFTLSGPRHIDMTFRCIPHKNEFIGGFMGVFWASYINAPADKSLYFLQAGSTLDKPQWVQYCTQAHGHASTVVHQADTFRAQPGQSTGSLFEELSPLRYAEPFYYGLFRDHVLIFIFERGPTVRFSHSPSGAGPTPAGDDTHPAWDFQLIVPDVVAGQEYGLRMRLVYKPWAGRDDVLAEVRNAYATVLK